MYSWFVHTSKQNVKFPISLEAVGFSSESKIKIERSGLPEYKIMSWVISGYSNRLSINNSLNHILRSYRIIILVSSSKKLYYDIIK